VHKTDAGAVRLNLSGAQEVEAAAQEMRGRVAAAGFQIEGFLVQAMAPPGVEMIVGMTHDATFGPVVACGAGGVLVELLKDVAVRVTPISDRDAHEMVTSLKTYPLLTGYRGGPRADVAALEEVVLRIGRLVEDLPQIVELDLNPVIVQPEGKGIRVVDARVRVGEIPPPLPLGAKRLH
jgi:acyl-CoA synthetase (NDP forming)